MKKTCIALALLSVCALSAQWQAKVAENEKSIELSCDSVKFDAKKKPQKVFPMVLEGLWIQKTFDLTRLPPDWRTGIREASLRIYCFVADQSVAVRKLPQRNGLTEELELFVAGKPIRILMSDKTFRGWWNWASIPIPVEAVTGDQLVVRLHKVRSSTNDDFFYLGIDSDEDPVASRVSIDNGKHFIVESKKHLAGLKGEFVIRLVLSR